MPDVTPLFEYMSFVERGPALGIARLPNVRPQRCAIVHRSREGACVCSTEPLPDWFMLREIDSRIERMCRVVWRSGKLVGAQYVNARTMGRSRPERRTSANGGER